MTGANLPSCIFVGTAKAGTTSIEHALRSHPQVAIPRKETFFFDHELMGGGRLPYPMQRDPGTVVTSEADYRQLYTGLEGRTTVEVGTGYLYHHAVAIPRIKAVLGAETRIGIVLRDPVERAWSSYMHFVKDLHEQLGFRDALALEAGRMAQGWDFMWHHVAMGKYAAQVTAYAAAFPNTRVFFFEDLRSNPAGFMRGIHEHAGVDHRDSTVVQARNRSGEPRFRGMQRLITTENPVKAVIRPLLRLVLPAEQRSRARKYIKERNMKAAAGLAAEDRQWLRDIYRTDVELLSTALGTDLFEKWHW